MRELFIYYRVPFAHAHELRHAVQEWHRSLMQRYPELTVRLLHRAESPLDTWMETFATDPRRSPDGVSAELQEHIVGEAQRFAGWIEGARHVEVFHACVS